VCLKNSISSVELFRLLDVERVADVVRCGRLRWFGHLEQKGRDDLVYSCRSFEVAGPKNRDRSKSTFDDLASVSSELFIAFFLQ